VRQRTRKPCGGYLVGAERDPRPHGVAHRFGRPAPPGVAAPGRPCRRVARRQTPSPASVQVAVRAVHRPGMGPAGCVAGRGHPPGTATPPRRARPCQHGTKPPTGGTGPGTGPGRRTGAPDRGPPGPSAPGTAVPDGPAGAVPGCGNGRQRGRQPGAAGGSAVCWSDDCRPGCRVSHGEPAGQPGCDGSASGPTSPYWGSPRDHNEQLQTSRPAGPDRPHTETRLAGPQAGVAGRAPGGRPARGPGVAPGGRGRRPGPRVWGVSATGRVVVLAVGRVRAVPGVRVRAVRVVGVVGAGVGVPDEPVG
jgi:hypothetical protein